MTYFSRLTDIVTCHLSSILQHASDPKAALEQILFEMEQGLAGAKRSVATAARNVEQIRKNQGEQQKMADHWLEQTKTAVMEKDDEKAKQMLFRRREAEALVAGLDQQLQSAVATHEHLLTMSKALEARRNEAIRKQAELIETGAITSKHTNSTVLRAMTETVADESSLAEIDAELEALKKELLDN
jgi:Phage shock protein A (IM30), suppresses sigma54-dependent transcription